MFDLEHIRGTKRSVLAGYSILHLVGNSLTYYVKSPIQEYRYKTSSFLHLFVLIFPFWVFVRFKKVLSFTPFIFIFRNFLNNHETLVAKLCSVMLPCMYAGSQYENRQITELFSKTYDLTPTNKHKHSFNLGLRSRCLCNWHRKKRFYSYLNLLCRLRNFDLVLG